VIRTAAVFALVLLAACGSDSSGGGRDRAADLMPGDGFLGLWIRAAEGKVFDGANLYGHINGGAEIFLELGFDRLEVRRYTSGKDEVILEIYRMDDPAAALGIYLMKCGAETPAPSLAERHTFNRYQIQMLKGAAYVTVSNPEAGKEAEKALVEFARHVAERLPDEKPPDLFGVLPAEDRVPGSERVIRGPFTLQAVYTFGKGDVLLLQNGVTAAAADFEDGAGGTLTRIAAGYPDAAAAAAALRHAGESFDPSLEVLSGDDENIVFRDYSGRYGKLSVSGAGLEATVNADEIEAIR